jgi:hypothetical protein
MEHLNRLVTIFFQQELKNSISLSFERIMHMIKVGFREHFGENVSISDQGPFCAIVMFQNFR